MSDTTTMTSNDNHNSNILNATLTAVNGGAEITTTQLVFTAICVLIVTLTLMYKNYQWKHPLPRQWPHVPYTIPWIGNLLQLGGVLHVVTALEKWAVQYGQEHGIFRITLGGVEYAVLCREDATLEIERQRPFAVIRDSMMTSAVKSTGGYGLFATEGEEWKQDKRMASASLNHASVNKYFAIMKTMSARLVNKWKKELNGRREMTKVINEDCQHALVDLSAKIFLGVDFDMLNDPHCHDAKDLRALDLAIGDRAFAPFAYWNIPFIGLYIDGKQWAIDRLLRKFLKVIEAHEAKADAGQVDESTFMAKAVNLNRNSKSSKTLSRPRLIGNILTMFVGAQDTQSSSFITALWLLASDKTDDQLQDELYEEAKQVNWETESSPKALLDQCPRILSFLNEAQRMFAAVPIEMFEVGEKPIQLQGETLQPGTPLIRMTRFTGLNPNAPCAIKPGPNGEDATQFVPRRWLTYDDEKSGQVTGCDTPNNKAGGFLAFGCALNMRDCPGRFYADVALVYMVGILLRDFKMELAPNHPPVGRVMGLTESVDRDLNMVLTKR